MLNIELYKDTINRIAKIPRTQFTEEWVAEFVRTKIDTFPEEDQILIKSLLHVRKEIDSEYDEKIQRLIQEIEQNYFHKLSELEEVEKHKFEFKKELLRAKFEELTPSETDDICVQIGTLIIKHIKAYWKEKQQEKIDRLNKLNQELEDLFNLPNKNHDSFIRGKIHNEHKRNGKEIVRAHIGKGALDKALEELKKIVDKKGVQEQIDEVIMLQSKHTALEEDDRRGTSNSEEVEQRRSQLIKAILDLTNLI